MKDYRIANEIFLVISTLALVAMVLSRFVRPILTVTTAGFSHFTDTCLLFVIAISLSQLAFNAKKTS